MICSAPAVRCGSPGCTVNGLTDPVGIDPDGCFFAWTLRGPGRAAAQTASRLVVRRTDPTRTGVVWDSGTLRSARQAFVAYAGPPLAADAAYEWTVQAQGAGGWGPVSAPARFTTALRDADWQAQWLRPAGASSQPDRVTYLRTEVTPSAGTVVRATAYVSAAHTYRLFVDGAPVDAWPSFSYPDEQYVRSVDLTRAIVGGRRSAIGVLHRWYGPGQGRPASSPGLLFQLSVWYRDGRHVVFGSDGTWRELPAEWLPSPQRNGDVGDFVEWVDGQAQPQGWSSPGYDDGAWSAVTVLGPAGTAPFSRMYAQRTTIRETPVHPVRLHAVAGGAVVADFGAVYAARPRVSFGRGVPGSTVTIRAGYLLDPDGQVSTLHGTQGTNLSSTYIMRAGSQAFEAFTYFGFRYLQIDERRPAARRRRHRGPHPACRHARRPDRHVLLGQPHAQRGLAALRPLVPLLLQRAVRRHADPGEGPVPLGRQQRIRGRDAGLRRPEHDLAGPARRRSAARPATGPAGRSTPSTPTATVPAPSPPPRRVTPSGSGATTRRRAISPR